MLYSLQAFGEGFVVAKSKVASFYPTQTTSLDKLLREVQPSIEAAFREYNGDVFYNRQFITYAEELLATAQLIRAIHRQQDTHADEKLLDINELLRTLSSLEWLLNSLVHL
jgi:hypothetical protein